MSGFDLRTHIRDTKSGRISVVQPYRLRISADGTRVYERGGKKYYENGVEVVETKVATAPVEVEPVKHEEPKTEKTVKTQKTA